MNTSAPSKVRLEYVVDYDFIPATGPMLPYTLREGDVLTEVDDKIVIQIKEPRETVTLFVPHLIAISRRERTIEHLAEAFVPSAAQPPTATAATTQSPQRSESPRSPLHIDPSDR